MKMVPKRLGPVLLIAVCSVALMAGCNDAPKSLVSPTEAVASFAKSTSGVSVKSTDPAFGDQGQTNETVTITGSGFQVGAQVAMLHNGQVDPTIAVSPAQVPNSNTIVVVVSIAANSPLDFRDVQVTNSDRTQGIGASVFEVTQAHVISGTVAGRAVNDNGEVTGSLADGSLFYYNISTGLLQSVSNGATGNGVAISPLGNAIAGTGGSGGGFPYLYTRAGSVGTAWTATRLPIGPTASGGAATALIADPVTGQVTMIGGFETLPTTKGAACSNAVIWTWQAATSTWQRILLPKNGACQSAIRPRGLSANGVGVGGADGAAVWRPDGSGGYTLTLLAGGIYANGINGDASMIVGETASAHGTSSAIYWTSSAAGWGSAVQFIGGCMSSRDIADASGRATLNNCPFPGTSVTYASYIDPPYTTITKLGGVGGHNNNFVGGISPSGNYMVGYGVTSGGVQVGAYWRP